MTDKEIIEHLRETAREASAVEVALALDRVLPDGLTQGSMVTYFKLAFPEIPLQTLLDAGGWRRLSAGALSDIDFNGLLRPWMPSARKEPDRD